MARRAGSWRFWRPEGRFVHPRFESGGHLRVTEPEIRASEREEKARRKVFRVQINSQGGELTLMWREPFFREF